MVRNRSPRSSRGGYTAMARGFVDSDRCGDGCIERRDGASHRQARELRACRLRRATQTLSFGSDDEDERAVERVLAQRASAGYVEADHRARAAQRLERARETAHA